jgi:lipid-binding SYLF domain-containing protein
MMKILSTLVVAALVAPVVPAFADDSPSAAAKKAGAEAVAAGEKAEKAGEKAEKAGDKAQRAMEARHERARQDAKGVKEARKAIAELEKADPGLTQFFDGAEGYVVFATVAKGAVGIGGARGTGVLYEDGLAIGNATLTQLTVGLQLGGQAYTEVIFFETDKALADFKKGEFTMAAQVSAVAATAGASANAKYVEGVSVFTLAKGGVMAEASVGGQKFSYQAFHKPVTTSSR